MNSHRSVGASDSISLLERVVRLSVFFFILVPLQVSAAESATTTISSDSTPGTAALSIMSPSYPDQNTWYNNSNAIFQWPLPGSVVAVRTLYGNDPSSVPNKVYMPPINKKEISITEDGVMYMHVQAKTAAGWGPVAHYKFQVDTKAPTDIKTTLLDGTETTHANPQIKVSASDDLSGLSGVDFVVDGATSSFPISQTGVYTLSGMRSGNHTVLVYVKDRAGNVASDKVSFAVTELKAPEIVQYQKYTTVGGVLKVIGSTYPNVPVEVTYTNTKNDKVYSKIVQSDNDGTFTSLWVENLPSGVYEMKTRVVEDGAIGAYSAPHVLDLEELPYIRLGAFIMNWLSLILVLILSAFSVAAAAWYGWLYFRRFRHGVHRTIKEVEGTLKTNVAALRRDSEEFYSLLVKTEKKRELTKEEKMVMRKFKKRLDIVEKEIENKLIQLG